MFRKKNHVRLTKTGRSAGIAGISTIYIQKNTSLTSLARYYFHIYIGIYSYIYVYISYISEDFFNAAISQHHASIK